MAAVVEKGNLEDELRKFHSSFELQVTKLSKRQVEVTIKKLKDDRENTTKSKDECMKINNFLSYLWILLGDKEKAIHLLDENLQKDPDNIIANANKARILLQKGEVSEAEEVLSHLQGLSNRQDYEKMKCYAEADLAYAYGRSGPWYHQRAIEIYERIVDVCPTEYAWQYGLGLALLRRIHRFISRTDEKFNEMKNEETTIRIAEIMLSVATGSEDPVLRAFAYAKLGKVVFDIEKKHYRNVPEHIRALDAQTCYVNATSCGPKEPTVLLEYGQFARNINDPGLSEYLLRQSLQINPTCQGYHQLALTLKRVVQFPSNRGNSRYEDKHETRDRAANRNWHHQQSNWRSRNNKRGADSYNRETSADVKEKKQMELIRKRIQSPLTVQVYRGNEMLIEAIELLNETEKLDESEPGFLYERGILYRMLGETGKAIEVFKKIVFRRKYSPTKALITNVYEQLGVCLLELSESGEICPNMKQKYKRDGELHLLRALQIQFEIVANDPQFKESWNSYSTLNELRDDKRDGKPQELIALRMRLLDHSKHTDVFKDMLRRGSRLEPNDCEVLLEHYMTHGKFEDSVTLLTMLECTTLFERLRESLIFDVYINGAFHAYSTDNTQMAHQHFRRAFHVYSMFGKVTYKTEAEEEEDAKEILILHSCPQSWRCSYPRDVGTILEGCTGLRYTVNADNLLANKITTESIVSMMQKIPCIMIMTHDSADHYDSIYVNHSLQLNSKTTGTRIVIVSDDECNIPDIARTTDVPFITLPPPLEGDIRQIDQMPVVHQDWAKTFIEKMKPN